MKFSIDFFIGLPSSTYVQSWDIYQMEHSPQREMLADLFQAFIFLIGLFFIPGTLIVAYMVYNILAKKLYGLFEDLMIKHIMIHRLYLWFTIFILFFLLYTHGYNPFF